MAERSYDVPAHTFSIWSDMTVVCPRCGRAGTVRFEKEHGIAQFRCWSCYLKKETVPCGSDTWEVTARCTATGKYFRVSRPGHQIHGQKARVKCPFCGELAVGGVSDKRDRKQVLIFEDIRNAQDPYFHYPLYFQASYRGKTVWALNREHLNYLIEFLSADIRAVRFDHYETCKTMRTQSDLLPAFMKTAKNRAGIVKLLTKLQVER